MTAHLHQHPSLLAQVHLYSMLHSPPDTYQSSTRKRNAQKVILRKPDFRMLELLGAEAALVEAQFGWEVMRLDMPMLAVVTRNLLELVWQVGVGTGLALRTGSESSDSVDNSAPVSPAAHSLAHNT